MKSKLVILLLIFIFSFSLVCAAENITDEEVARACIEKSKATLDELQFSNFSVERVNDSLSEATNLFDAQILLKEKGRSCDFSLVFSYCKQIEKNRKDAFEARDGLDALCLFYNESIDEGMNSSSVDEIISEIGSEIDTERYEKVGVLLEKGYDEILDVQESYTALNLFYRSTTRGIKDFFIDYWKTFLLSVAVLIVLFVIYHNTVRRWNIKRKIRGLETEKQVLKGLIQKMQKDYFEEGSVSERDYTIRTKKFAELIRDIDRQIPLLREAFVKIDKKYARGSGAIKNDTAAARDSLLAITGSRDVGETKEKTSVVSKKKILVKKDKRKKVVKKK